MKQKKEKNSSDSQQYPGVRKVIHRISVDYHRSYSLRSYILLFFTFSMLGWVWEVGLCLFMDGKLANRGVLFGPWLPIYGVGGVLVLILFKRFADNPVLTFFLTMFLCSVIEYFTSWILEYTKGVRWWDYSGYFLNINGRICLEASILFGLGGCASIYFLAPFFDQLFQKIPVKIQDGICIILVCIFLCDAVHALFYPNMGVGISDYEIPSKPSHPPKPPVSVPIS
jgi:uncharacterized membrane protein